MREFPRQPTPPSNSVKRFYREFASGSLGLIGLIIFALPLVTLASFSQALLLRRVLDTVFRSDQTHVSMSALAALLVGLSLVRAFASFFQSRTQNRIG
jgi:hypothetical protein